MTLVFGRLMVLYNAPRSLLGEGLVWLPEPGVLYWVDIFDDRIHSLRLSDGFVKSIKVGPYPSCVMPNDDGNLVVTIKDKVILVNPEDDSVIRTLATVNEGAGNRFNDCKCNPMDRLVAGIMDMGEKNLTGSLYILDSGGLRRILSSVTISNGIAWSLDGSIMHYIDSPTRRVAAYDYDVKHGELEGLRDVIDLSSQPGLPDGITIDSEGNLWVALWGGGRVVRFNPFK